MKKQYILIIGLLVIVCFFSSCSLIDLSQNTVRIPDIKSVDEDTAKNILENNSLIPCIEYIYNEYTEEGRVIRTSPQTGADVEKNQKVTVYISKGPSYIESSDAVLTWWNVSYANDDNWEFYAPYIQENTLYIKFDNIVFTENIIWQDDHSSGRLFGIASINDVYDKSVPVSARYSKQEWTAYESQSFTLEIPLADLDVDKPTSLYIRLYASVNGIDQNIEISFTISW